MDLAWVSPSFASGELAPALDSPLASERYRMLLPGRELAARGHRVRLIRAGDDAAFPEIAIFGKLSNSDTSLLAAQIRANLEFAAAAKQAGTRIVADFCDNHFGDPLRGDYARGMLRVADLVVAGTEVMRDHLEQQTALPIHVIPDPVEGPGGVPRFNAAGGKQGVLSRLFKPAQTAEPMRLLWYGHQSGLTALERFLPELEAAADACKPNHPFELEILCAPGFGAEDLVAGLQARGRVAARFTPWSPVATWDALQRCDLVVLPGIPGEFSRSAKSANRLLEAVWAGRYVLAHPVPSYEVFADHAWVSEDLTTGLMWALRNSALVPSQIAGGQQRIREHFLPAAVAASWESALRNIPERRGPAAVSIPSAATQNARAGEALKLNLGCGDKILSGYVNVDVAASRNGAQPDVLCDLHELSPFASGSADEILSVHVIEHFWRWEVDAILAEWVRVLKPGGRMVVECPNLAAACEALLADPDVGPGAEGNRSLWVLYGDPAWRDPLMCHRWGYTPVTLARLLQNAGLAEVRQEAAQYKMREPRDMRVVGIKPA